MPFAFYDDPLLQVGLLLRLEPNRNAGMYRLTVRASRDGVAQLIVDALEPHF